MMLVYSSKVICGVTTGPIEPCGSASDLKVTQTRVRQKGLKRKRDKERLRFDER